MYIIDWDQVKPKSELLAQCHRVDVDGHKHSVGEMRRWARKHLTSLIWLENTNMSNASSWTGPNDLVSFYFGNKDDALVFQIKWT